MSDRIINDPIHGHFTLSNLAWAIIDSPNFQRLRDIRQLGNVHYVFPGATHTRFQHCIGVAHLCRRLMTHLLTLYPSIITYKDILVAELAGLCHDMGHGPFSHLIEHIFTDFCHEKKSCERVQSFFESHTNLFYKEGLQQEDVDAIKYMISKNFGKLSQKYKKKPYLDLLDGREFDLDKLDYIQRDSYFCGFKNYFDATRMLCTIRIVEKNGEGVEKCTGIGFTKKGESCIKDLLDMRAKLFENVYHHPVVLEIDSMAKSIFLMASETKVCVQRGGHAALMDFSAFASSTLADDSILKILKYSAPTRHPEIYSAIVMFENRQFRKFKM